MTGGHGHSGRAPVGRPNSPTPLKASVLMLAYNHEKYIGQALESALSQQVDFQYEIVVGEDCSRDRTRDIVLEFQQQHPQRVRVLPRERNVGMMRNFGLTLEACRGEYVALLDGDDYWTSPRKLARQVEFLDSHRDCAFCFHNWDCLDEEGRGRRWILRSPKERYTLEDVLQSNPVMASSVMFRRGLFGPLPSWVYGLGFADWPVHVLNAQHGDGGYIDEKMAVYRVHTGQSWMNLTPIPQLEASVRFYEAVRRHLGSRCKQTVSRCIAARCLTLKDLHEHAGNLRSARRYAWRYVWERPLEMPVRRLARGLRRLYLRAE